MEHFRSIFIAIWIFVTAGIGEHMVEAITNTKLQPVFLWWGWVFWFIFSVLTFFLFCTCYISDYVNNVAKRMKS